MRRGRAAAAIGVALAVVGIAGAAAFASGGDGDEPDAAPASAAAVTSAPRPPRPTAPAPPTPRPAATTTTTTTTTPAVPTTTTTTSTIAPIVTHDARVGVGVLTPVAVAAPVRVVIPAIGADGPVTPTGVDATGGLAIPGDARELVWWQFGPTPGAAGSAVIAGHLDWKGVPGTFNDLAATPVGEVVTVAYDDGHEQRFVVASVELVDKPAVAVDGTFARDGEPVLRLVTCGGEFDRASHHYRSNVVVTAVPA